ncbi:MAG: SRPBCC family protein [Pyrinomonadaceae bacterium]
MAEHVLKTSLTIGRPRAEVFAFFADAGNLERITPPELGFQIITPLPFEIRMGTLIDYRMRMRGIPLSWRTEITEWNPDTSFVDSQLRGPYSQWIHRHTFTQLGPAKTLIEDEVRYRLPLGPLGSLVHFLVRRELDYIFGFRQEAVRRILADEAQAGHSPS